jgi:hypothetical protein
VKAEGIGGEREDKFKENFIVIVHFANNEEKYFFMLGNSRVS